MTNQVQTRQVVDPLAVDLEQVPKIMQLNSGQETDVTGQKKKKRIQLCGAKGSGQMMSMTAVFSTPQAIDKHH